MILNKIKYILVILILFVFNMFYDRYFPVVLLLVCITIPIIFVIMLLYINKKVQIDIKTDSDIYVEGDEVEFTIDYINSGLLPLSSSDIVLSYSSDLESIKSSKILNVCVDSKHNDKLQGKILVPNCGKLVIELEFIKIYDYLKIFKFKKLINKKITVLVYPKVEELNRDIIDTFNTDKKNLDSYLKSEDSDDYSEIFDIREYREGDRLNRVHWKLSTKYDKLMVKDFAMTIDAEKLILLETYNSDCINAQIRDVFSISTALIENNIYHYIAWYDSESCKFNKEIVMNEEERDTVIGHILNSSLINYSDKVLGFIEAEQEKKVFYITGNEQDVKLNSTSEFIVIHSKKMNDDKCTLSDDISFQNRDEKIKTRNIIYNILTLLAIVIGTIGTVIHFYEIEQGFELYVAGIIFSALFTTIFLYKKYLKYSMKIIVGIYITISLLYWDTLKNTIPYIFNSIVQKITENAYAIKNISQDIAESDILFTIMLIMFLLIGLLAYATIYKSNFYIVFMITFIIIETGLFPGIIPPIILFILVILAWLSLITIQVNNNGYESEFNNVKDNYRINTAQKSAQIMSGIMVVFFASIMLTFTENVYDNSVFIPELREEINQAFNTYEINNYIDKVVTGTVKGGVSGGKLGDVNEIKYNNEVALKLYVEQDVAEKIFYETEQYNIYLKGYVGANYVGNAFEEVSNEEYNKNLDSDYNYQNLANDIKYENVSFGYSKVGIVNINANSDYAYLPYNTQLDQEENFINEKDLYVIPKSGNEKYSVNYLIEKGSNEYWNGINNSDSKLLNRLEEYDKYVNNIYTRLPEKIYNSIKQNIKKFDNDILKIDIEFAVAEVKKYLWENTEYTLKPGKTPKDKDFVEYFLFENKKGYCSHYATAATVILRSIGIPTRYVEGYCVDTHNLYTSSKNTVADDRSKEFFGDKKVCVIDVLDSSAHAWIEVFDGVSWQPYDVTPSREETVDEEKTIDEEVKDNNEESSSSVEKQDDNVEEEKQLNNNSQANSDINSNGEYGVINKSNSIFNMLNYLLIILLSLEIVINKRYMNLTRIKFGLHCKNRNKGVNIMYKYLMDIFKYLKLSEQDNIPYKEYANKISKECNFVDREKFSEVIEIILKANYSDNIIEEEEYLIVKRFVKDFQEKVYDSLSIKQKLYYKYIKNLG